MRILIGDGGFHSPYSLLACHKVGTTVGHTVGAPHWANAARMMGQDN